MSSVIVTAIAWPIAFEAGNKGSIIAITTIKWSSGMSSLGSLALEEWATRHSSPKWELSIVPTPTDHLPPLMRDKRCAPSCPIHS